MKKVANQKSMHKVGKYRKILGKKGRRKHKTSYSVNEGAWLIYLPQAMTSIFPKKLPKLIKGWECTTITNFGHLFLS